MSDDIKCPICGSETTLRTAKKGSNAGRQFYVCIYYPECKGKADYRIQNKIIEPDKPRDQHEQDTQTARADFERYKLEQATIIENEKANFERYKTEQETIIENEKAEFERYKTEQEAIIENKNAKLERYKVEQEAIAKNDNAEFERCKAEQETIAKNEIAEFERYKAEQETIAKSETAEFERYKTEQEAIIKNEKAEFERYKTEQEQIIQIENRRAKDRLQQIDSQTKLKEAINEPGVIVLNEKCVVHQSRNAIAICTTCGEGVCDICRTGLGDKTYCPSCFNKSLNSKKS